MLNGMTTMDDNNCHVELHSGWDSRQKENYPKEEADSAAWTWDANGGLVWKHREAELEPESNPYLTDKQQEFEVLEVERKARERLERRFALAAQEEKLALEDKEQAFK